ncbi:MAG: hypothetical protein ABEJ89_05420 [Haloarculaceae archaeon]
MVTVERGQAHTLEAIVAGLVLLSSLVFALQMTAVTPLSASTSSQHIENQQRAAASGVLAAAAENGTLRDAALYWNESAGRFHNVSRLGYYTDETPDGLALARMLDRTYADSVAFNVYLVYGLPDGGANRVRLIYRGVPSDNAVTAARNVVLTDNATLIAEDGTETTVPVSNSSTFYAPELHDGSPVYNVIRVEVVAWRI